MTLREYEHFLCLAIPAVKIFILLLLSDEYKKRNDDDLWQSFQLSKYEEGEMRAETGLLTLYSLG